MCKKSVESAIKFIAKNANLHAVRDADKSVWEYDALVYATDTFQVIRTLEDISSELIHERNDQSKQAIAQFFDDKMLTGVKSCDCPDVVELEKTIKNLLTKNKSKNIPSWQTHIVYGITNELRVNAEYLLNALKSTGATKMYLTGTHNPIYFFGEDTQYFLLPVCTKVKIKAGETKVIN